MHIAGFIADRIGGVVEGARYVGQSSGRSFEATCRDFLVETFLVLTGDAGDWVVLPDGSGKLAIDAYGQYYHLADLSKFISKHPELLAYIGNDYTVHPDLLIVRRPWTDERLNATSQWVADDVAKHAWLRGDSVGTPILHASISCKWTLRSDRAQNARTEALNLLRNRRGRAPHIVVVTAEPMPSRLASIALGTGDLDCVYHFALYELVEAVAETGDGRAMSLLAAMIDGRRLKDISDLPLDLLL